jgi:hypothetical protein
VQNYDHLTQASSGNPNSRSLWLRYHQHHPVWNADLTLLWRHRAVYMPMTSQAFQNSSVLLWFRSINKELSRGRSTWSLMAKLLYLFVEPWNCLDKKIVPWILTILNNKMDLKVAAKYLHYWHFLSCCFSITEILINVQMTLDTHSSTNHMEAEWHSLTAHFYVLFKCVGI